jgi:hypothetical protein
MSWGMNFIGTKQGVRKKVEEATGYGDQSQLEAAKAFIISEIDALPAAVNGVKVEASGHHDAHTTRNVSIKVDPVLLALDEEEQK